LEEKYNVELESCIIHFVLIIIKSRKPIFALKSYTPRKIKKCTQYTGRKKPWNGTIEEDLATIAK
jgi:hypothetical protein